MRRLILAALALCVMSSLSLVRADQATAQEVTIFGVKGYAKAKGEPMVFTDTFKADPWVSNYKIIVRKDLSAGAEARNFTVLLNGAEVVSARDMHQTDLIIKPVDLLPENTLEVEVKGAEGRPVWVGIQGTVIEKR
jgi:hypothetical protein